MIKGFLYAFASFAETRRSASQGPIPETLCRIFPGFEVAPGPFIAEEK